MLSICRRLSGVAGETFRSSYWLHLHRGVAYLGANCDLRGVEDLVALARTVLVRLGRRHVAPDHGRTEADILR